MLIEFTTAAGLDILLNPAHIVRVEKAIDDPARPPYEAVSVIQLQNGKTIQVKSNLTEVTRKFEKASGR